MSYYQIKGGSMIKVFSFVASCAGKESNTALFSDMVAKRLKEYAEKSGKEVEYKRITGESLKIEFCRSCETCFYDWECPLDNGDDMSVLKQKMLCADVILFCSPVYMGSMSGLMKCVVDRLAYWSHLYELAGKTAAVLVTSSNNHGAETASAIEEAVRMFGASVAYSGCAYRHNADPGLNNRSDMDPILDEICGRLMDCLEQPYKYITREQDISFYVRGKENLRAKAFAEIFGSDLAYDAAAWEQRGFDRYNRLSDYLKNGNLVHSSRIHST